MFNTFYHKLVTTYVINRFFQIKNLTIASAIRLQAKQEVKIVFTSFSEYICIFLDAQLFI